jgi:hypothetical protein
MARQSDAAEDVMITPGVFEPRVVRGIRTHFILRSDDDTDDTYEDTCSTGIISLDGKRTPVVTGYWGGWEVWQLDRESEAWPRCPMCGACMDIGSALYWRCGSCGHSRHSRTRGDDRP